MKSIESSAKTIEDAIRQGLEKLDVSLGDVAIDIIQEGSKGLFGLVGGKVAIVRLTVKETEQEDDILFSLACNVQDTQPQSPSTKSRKRRKKPAQAKKIESAAASDTAKPVKEAEKPAPKPQPKSLPKTEKIAADPEPLKDYPVSDPSTAVGKAQDFIVNVTQLMNLQVAVEAKADDDGSVRVNIHGDTLGILIGRRGETLDALQYLTSLNVNHGKDDYTRVTLDTENYRAKREEALKRLANRMANRAVKTGRKVVMEPMNPYERRILHSALQQNTSVTTHSEGDEPNRHVVISLK